MPYLGKQPARTPIDASDIPDDSITAAKIVDGTIVAADIATGAVDTAELAADAVTGAKIEDNAVDSEHIAADSIDAEHYAAGSVDTTALGADCVTAAKIGDNVLDSEHYAAASIDNEHLADDAVGVAELSATGTASSSTYLRGDNSWATVSTFEPDGAVTINDTGADVDFRVETDTNANALVVNGGANKIGMGMDVDSNDANLTIYTAGDTSTTSDKIMFKSAFGNGGKHGISWKDASNIVARISAEYESSSASVDTVFSSQYNSGYIADTVETLRIVGDGRGLSQFTAKAWCNFDGTGTPAFRDSHNCSSLTDISTGNWTVVYTNAIGANNCIVGQCKASAYLASINIPAAANSDNIRAIHNNGTVMDVDYAGIVVFGD